MSQVGDGGGVEKIEAALAERIEQDERLIHALERDEADTREELHELERPSSFHIIVNAQPKTVTSVTVSYAEITKIAFPNDPPEQHYSVTYAKGASVPHHGSLAPGQSVKVQNGTIFDVDQTHRS